MDLIAPSGGKEDEGREKEGEDREKGSQVQVTSSQGGKTMGGENIALDRELSVGLKKTVSCNECGSSLLSSSLNKHRKRFHPQERQNDKVLTDVSPKKRPDNKCRETRWEVLSKPRTDKVSTSNQERKVKCDECGKDFTAKKVLRWHKKTVHQGERLPCKVAGCEKTFWGYKQRENHMRMVHGSPKLRCKVEGCFSEFYSGGGLKYHHDIDHQE